MKIKVMVVGEIFVIGVYVNDTSIWDQTSFRSPRSPPEVHRKYTGSSTNDFRKNSPKVLVNRTVRPRSSKSLMQFLIRFFNILGAIFFNCLE